MSERIQAGSVIRDPRARVWFFRWREQENGKPVRRAVKIGTFDEFKSKAAALREVERRGLRVKHIEQHISEDRPGATTLRAVVQRYMREEMPERFSTRAAYDSYLKNHILPKWGDCSIAKIASDPYAIKMWLKELALAPKSKTHVKGILSRLFDCAMLWKMLDLQINPMSLVKIKDATKRQEEPRVLTQEEFLLLLNAVDEEPFRTMVLTDMCLGLRCSELLAIKWSDFDWENLTLKVQRAIVAGRVGEVKTRFSMKTVPIDADLAEALWSWKQKSEFNKDTDWVWASPFQAGEKPYLSLGVQQRRLKPAALRAGLGPIGWHTLRHTYRAWLDETGAPMTVQQELMRHADIRTTMNIYGSAMTDTKRKANSKVAAMAIPSSKKAVRK